MPPLGCLEGSNGRRICEDSTQSREYKKTTTTEQNYVPWVHPATIKQAEYKPVFSIGQQVKSIPAAEFLSNFVSLPAPKKKAQNEPVLEK
jgi:hypothetical protein